MPDGQVMDRAQCKFCPKHYVTSAGGTGHLRRHMDKCMPAHGQVDTTTQTQLQRHPDGSVSTWRYDPMVARECMARYIACTDQPISFGDNAFYEEFIQTAYNPQFQAVSRNTTRNDLIKCFQTQRDKLKAELHQLTVSIALTSDIWNAFSKQDYLTVTGHYLDSDWNLQKKVLGFRPMEYAHTAVNIFNVITSVLETFEITDHIISITLDNASANTSSIALFFEKNIPQHGGYFFHQRCACHIINLVVQSGMKLVSDRIDRIRDALAWISSSTPRLNEFGRYCKTFGLRPRRFLTDMPVRWNSTYLMLLNALEYETPISGFYNLKMSQVGSPLLTPDDWHVAKVFVEFLKVFYDSTVILSGVYYPTSSLAIHHVVEMSELLNNYREDDILGPAVVAMEKKFTKYWSTIPLLYALGVIIDPRVKLSGLETLLEYLGNILSIDYSTQITDIRTKLFEVFSSYEHRYGDVAQQPLEVPDTRLNQTSWNLLKRRKKVGASSSSSGASATSGAELKSYLDAQYDDRAERFDRDKEKGFDLLVWWKTYSYKYPVLSHLARVILVIPVSTVSSEQVFSTTGRIVEERSSSMTPEMVEVLACVRDWEHARKRLQNETVDEEFVQNFSNLYVEESSGSNQI